MEVNMQVKDDKELSKKYNEFVKSVTKENNMWIDMLWAFIVGGIICSIGQGTSPLLQIFRPAIFSSPEITE